MPHPDRDKILARVRRNEMSVEAAEKWAAENAEIFSVEPDLALFEPMKEPNWTLPMVAAWIIGRSCNAVRLQWDKYRTQRRSWVATSTDFGFELREGAPAVLFGVFRRFDPDSDNDPLPFAQELYFALRSGQLTASGTNPFQQKRLQIANSQWMVPFVDSNQADVHDDSIYAIAIDADHDELFTYGEVRVDRDAVLSIWAPITKSTVADGAVNELTRLAVQPAPTLPTGFDQPDWNAEHVVCWIAHRNLGRLRALELPDPKRPEWYGRSYRGGCVDAGSADALRVALITGKLSGIRGETPVTAESWHENSIRRDGIWFRSDQVQKVWPDPTNAETNAALGGEPKSPSATPSLTRTNKRTGRPPEKMERVKAQMHHWLDEEMMTYNNLEKMRGKELEHKCQCGRTLACEVRAIVLSERRDIEKRQLTTND